MSLPQDCPIDQPRKRRKTPKKYLEGTVLREGLTWLRQYGLFVWRSNTGAVQFDTGDFMRFGFPGSADITGILPDGRRLECEAKRRVGGKQSDKQRLFQKLTETNHGVYILFHSVEELAEKLVPILRETGVLIPLTQGESSRIDFQDWDQISVNRWSVWNYTTNLQYAERSVSRKTIRMHRQILVPPSGMVIDHINGNGLDNRRGNLRITSQKKNTFNSRPSPNGISQFKGVSFDARKSHRQKPWVAAIQPDGKKIFIGYFTIEIEAAKAYDEKALEIFGEFAFLNFPTD